MKAWVLAASILAAAPMQVCAADNASVRNVRVGAVDVAAAATFYKSVFGMQEIQRYERQGFLEIILNFGATVDEAKAASATRIAVISRKPDQAPDGVSNIVMNVGDIQATVARVQAQGGDIEKPATRSQTSGNTIAMVRDPAGNRVELIMRP